MAAAAKLWQCSKIGCAVSRWLVHCARMLQECASFISAPYRLIDFINRRILIAGTQRLTFDLIRLRRQGCRWLDSHKRKTIDLHQAVYAETSKYSARKMRGATFANQLESCC